MSKFKVGDKVRGVVGDKEGVVTSVPRSEDSLWCDVKWYGSGSRVERDGALCLAAAYVAVPRTLLRALGGVLGGDQKAAVLKLLGEGHFGPSKPPCSGCGGYKWVGCGDRPGCSECRPEELK